VYADDVNLLGDNIDTVKTTIENLIEASKEVGIEVDTEKTKHMLLSHHQNAGQTHDIKRANRCLKMWHTSDIWERL
jgi:biotin operon repressor